MLSNFELASHKGAPCYVRFTDLIYSYPYKKEQTWIPNTQDGIFWKAAWFLKNTNVHYLSLEKCVALHLLFQRQFLSFNKVKFQLYSDEMRRWLISKHIPRSYGTHTTPMEGFIFYNIKNVVFLIGIDNFDKLQKIIFG